MSNIASFGGIASRDDRVRALRRVERGADERVGRQLKLRAAALQQLLGHVDAIGLDERLSGLEPHRLEERAGHRAADDQRSTFGSSCSMTSILPEILAPPRMATKGR